MRARVSGLVACLAVLLSSVTAQAEVVAMLRIKRDPSSSERDEWAVTHVITDFFAEQESPVVLPNQARQRLGRKYVECDMQPCAARYIEKLAADLAVGAVVFAEAGEVQAVNIAVIRPDGLAFTGSVQVGVQGLSVAARDAMALAWERYQRGPGPWLEVRGAPGQRLLVDGELSGALPYRDRVQPGMHQLRVEDLNGVPHYEATLSVPNDPAQYSVIDATERNVPLPPEPVDTAFDQPDPAPAVADDPRPLPAPAPRVSPYNYVAGGALIGVGGLLLIPGAITIARDGECKSGESPCDTYTKGAQSSALIATGAVLTGVGIAWLAWRPLRNREAMEVSLRGTMLHLEGRF